MFFRSLFVLILLFLIAGCTGVSPVANQTTLGLEQSSLIRNPDNFTIPDSCIPRQEISAGDRQEYGQNYYESYNYSHDANGIRILKDNKKPMHGTHLRSELNFDNVTIYYYVYSTDISSIDKMLTPDTTEFWNGLACMQVRMTQDFHNVSSLGRQCVDDLFSRRPGAVNVTYEQLCLQFEK